MANATLAIGTNRAHARVHQFGATIEAKNGQALVFALGDRIVQVASVTVPARPFLGLSNADREEAIAILEDFLSGLWSASATERPPAGL